MADPPRYPDADDGTGTEPDSGLPPSGPPRAPRWVKVSGIIVGALILLVVIVKLTSLSGDHGPGRHTGASSTPPAAVTEIRAMPGGNPDGHARPEGSY